MVYIKLLLDIDRVSVVKGECISILIDCMNSGDEKMLLHSSTIIAKSSSSQIVKKTLVDSHIIPLMIEKIKSDEHDIKVNCCTVLNKLAINEENCKSIGDINESIELIQKCLELNSTELDILVINLLYKLALNCEDNIQIILEKDVPKSVIKCLEIDDDNVKIAAFDTIHWLSLKSIKLEAFEDDEIMGLLVNCLNSGNTDVVRHACTTLYWLCYNDPELVPFVVDYDIIGRLIICLDNENVPLQTISLNAIIKLSYNSIYIIYFRRCCNSSI